MYATILTIAALTSLVISTPIQSRDETAAAILLKIVPESSACLSTGAYASECATNEQAAPYLIQAFKDYNIQSSMEMAAVIANIAYESGNFKYNIHHFPSENPGQGTRNMQNVEFNLAYAKSLGLLANSPSGISASATASSLTTQQKNDLLTMVAVPEHTWASSAWLLTSICYANGNVRDQLINNGAAGWAAYMSCIGAGEAEDRLAVWKTARTAFGLGTS